MIKEWHHVWIHVDTIGFLEFVFLSEHVIQPEHHSESVSGVIDLAQAWAFQEENTVRTYAITRLSGTKVGRQGRDVIACFGYISC